MKPNPSDELLQEVERFAGLQFTRREVELITGVSTKCESFEIYYLRGALKKEADIREAIFTAALNQSATAQAEALRLIKNRQTKS